MSPAPYPDFRRLLRPLRALPIVAVAALVGGIIGGFSVFALDLALTTPPSHDASAEVGRINAEKATDVAAAPAAGTSAPPVPEQTAVDNTPPRPVVAPPPNPQGPAQGLPQTQAQTAPQITVTPPLSAQQTTWPDALSREHTPAPTSVAPVPAAAPTTTASAPQPAAPQPAMAASRQVLSPQVPALQAARADSTSGQPVNTEFARKPIPAKRYVTVKRKAQGAASDGAEASARTGRPVYNSYGRSDEAGPSDARARYRYTDRRYSVRRQHAEDDDDRSGDGRQVEETDRSDAMPPQPAPPPLFFGLFGGGDRDDDQ